MQGSDIYFAVNIDSFAAAPDLMHRGCFAMPKNILIFSDGTGQAGGLMPDEARSNVYKLFRATRCGPDSCIDPSSQVAFYDPGLGSKADGANAKLQIQRKVYNFLAQATGLGITRNIIDCHAEIIRLWEPGDRIYLFGFSRGAYTVRCVGGVLGYCGVPTMVDGVPIKRDEATARAIATEAVKGVYQFGSSMKGDPRKSERVEKARAFRAKYASEDGDGPNAVPYFFGVWDTVSTLGMGTGPLLLISIVALALATVAVHWIPALLTLGRFGPGWLASAGVVAAAAAIVWLVASVRYRQPLSLARFRMAFYDTNLNPRVRYARHALSIDENRRDFPRVVWTLDRKPTVAPEPGARDRLEQVWFAGVHSDVGGSYAENESRLSDIALKWMLDQARSLPHPILADDAYLRLWPSPAGMQHDARKSAVAEMHPWLRRVWTWLRGADNVGWAKGLRKVPHDAPLHPSVLERFECAGVLDYDVVGPYRPEPLREHDKVKHYYAATSVSDVNRAGPTRLDHVDAR
jgi:uncharacterized protein (DUF2235 family)